MPSRAVRRRSSAAPCRRRRRLSSPAAAVVTAAVAVAALGCAPLAGAQGIKHFENLVNVASFRPATGGDGAPAATAAAGGTAAAASAASALAASVAADAVVGSSMGKSGASGSLVNAGGGLRGPMFTEIASIIASASKQEHAERAAATGVIEVPDCADEPGLTAIRINGAFATCAHLGNYCEKYQQVKDACPATCGLCDDELAEAAAVVLDAAVGGGEAAETAEVAAAAEAVETAEATEVAAAAETAEAAGAAGEAEAAGEGQEAGQQDAEEVGEVEDKLTPEEHVIALTLLLKQVSMENEHLKLSMSQCEADVIELKMKLIDQHSEH